MSIHKDSNGTWKVAYSYTDWQGNKKRSTKRGFATKREAAAWEREFLSKSETKMDMTFGSFVKIYEKDKGKRICENTWGTKDNIMQTKILPYFKDRKMNEIKSTDIIAWQNVLMDLKKDNGEPYSPSYLKTIHNQLSAVFNHAVNFYDLPKNPARNVRKMGRAPKKEMLFWTEQEYKQFSYEMMSKPVTFYAFEILYWCGLRIGELLALTPKDFNFNNNTVTISKSYQRLNGKDVITPPKTEKGNRVVKMPEFLAVEISEYIKSIYSIKDTDRVFSVISKNHIERQMKTGSAKAGVKKIRIHDLRHSHVSLLIHMGYSVVAIADRMGHEGAEITYMYGHMFPSTQDDMALKLDTLRKDEFDYVS